MSPACWLAVSMCSAVIILLADLLGASIPFNAPDYIPRLILCAIGSYTIFTAVRGKKKKISEKSGSIAEFPQAADRDGSSDISFSEAITMGLSLSADAFFSGAGAGTAGIPAASLSVWALILGFLACMGGTLLGIYLEGRSGGEEFPCGIIGGLLILAAAIII